jgi:hypothetical protein
MYAFRRLYPRNIRAKALQKLLMKRKDSIKSVENSAETLRLCYYSRNLQRTNILNL